MQAAAHGASVWVLQTVELGVASAGQPTILGGVEVQEPRGLKLSAAELEQEVSEANKRAEQAQQKALVLELQVSFCVGYGVLVGARL